MYDKSLAKIGGRGWVGSRYCAVDASGVWKLAGGVWVPVEADPAAQLFFGASRPTSPVAEVTAIASVLRMLHAARVSIPLVILSDSKYALGLFWAKIAPFRRYLWSSWRGARHDATGNVLALIVATWLRTGCLQATRLLTDWRMLAAGGGWCWSGLLRSCPAYRRFLDSQRHLSLRWPIASLGKKIKDEVDPLRPIRSGRQSLEVVELIFGSANVRTLLPAERSAASRACPPAMTGRHVDLADQLHQAGFPSWVFTKHDAEDRLQVCVADQASHGGVELWIRQDIMGDPRSFHVLVAEPRFLLVKGHTAAGVIQFCVCHGPDSTRNQAEIMAWWCRSAALIRSDCQVSLPLPKHGLDRSFMPCSWNGTFVCQPRCLAAQ